MSLSLLFLVGCGLSDADQEAVDTARGHFLRSNGRRSDRYHTMNGPSEFHVIGSLKDWDISDRLHEIDDADDCSSRAVTTKRRR